MSGSSSASPLISAGPTLPRTSKAATGNGRLYCAASVVRGSARGEPARFEEGPHRDLFDFGMAEKCVLAPECATASIAGCAQRQTG